MDWTVIDNLCKDTTPEKYAVNLFLAICDMTICFLFLEQASLVSVDFAYLGRLKYSLHLLIKSLFHFFLCFFVTFFISLLLCFFVSSFSSSLISFLLSSFHSFLLSLYHSSHLSFFPSFFLSFWGVVQPPIICSSQYRKIL